MGDRSNYDLDKLLEDIAAFSKERDWEQYHTPKNLSMALAVEASELMEIFQWLTPEQSTKDNLSPERIIAIREEIADVLIYSIRIAQVLDIDILKAIAMKMEKNNRKYPVEKAKGKATLE